MTLDMHYSSEFWEPTLFNLVPKGLSNGPRFIILTIYFTLKKFFGNSSYGIFIVYCEGHIVHYSILLPKYFRFPFMKKGDLHIGPIWTHGEHRGKGLALYAVRKIFELYRYSNRRFWFVTGEENNSARRVAEKSGFMLYGRGIRKKILCIRVIDLFVIEEKL
jgi:predicted acetyltransferase